MEYAWEALSEVYGTCSEGFRKASGGNRLKIDEHTYDTISNPIEHNVLLGCVATT